MSSSVPGQRELQVAVAEANESLSGENSRPLSESGYKAFRTRIDEFIFDLFNMAAMSARRRRGDVISASDVNRASDELTVSGRSGWLRLVSVVGGVLLGAGLSNALSMILYDKYTGLSVAASVILCAIGGAMVVAELIRD